MSFQCQTPGYALAATRLNPRVTRLLQSKNTGVSEFLKLHNRTAFPDQDTAGQQRIMQFCDSLTRALASADVETMYGEMVSDASGPTPTVQITSSSEVSTTGDGEFGKEFCENAAILFVSHADKAQVSHCAFLGMCIG